MSDPIDEALSWSFYATLGFTVLNYVAMYASYTTGEEAKEYVKVFQNAVEIDITQQNANKILSEVTVPKLVCVTGYLAPRFKDGEIRYLKYGDKFVEDSTALAIEDIQYSRRNGKILDDINKFNINSIKTAPMILSSRGNSQRHDESTKNNKVLNLHLSDIHVSKELQDQVTLELLPQLNELPRSVRKKLLKLKGMRNKGLDIIAPKAVHHGSFIRSDEFDLSRQDHTYDDYWSGTFRKAVQYIVPTFLNCSIIGNLSIDSDGKFYLSPHPLVGLIMFRSVHFPDLIKFYEESIVSYISVEKMCKKLSFIGYGATGVVGLVYLYRYVTKPPSHTGNGNFPPPSTSTSQNSECPICLESTMTNAVALVPCGHCYCKACIEQHMAVGARRNACCPVCKTAIQSTLRIFA